MTPEEQAFEKGRQSAFDKVINHMEMLKTMTVIDASNQLSEQDKRSIWSTIGALQSQIKTLKEEVS